MYGIIYKATGPTGRVYIGQTTYALKIRKGQHKYRAKKQDRRGVFQIALLEHGFDNFIWEQIDHADTVEELDRKEKEWITFYDSMNPKKGYNGTDGGMGGHLSAEARRKIGRAHEGKFVSEETLRKISEWHTGRTFGEEARRRMSDGQKKRWGMKTKEEMDRWAESKKKENLSGFTRKKISQANKGSGNGRAKITEEIAAQIKIELSLDKTHGSVSRIARKYNVSRDCVNKIKFGVTWGWLNAS
jgi:group I intron endonuclease